MVKITSKDQKEYWIDPEYVQYIEQVNTFEEQDHACEDAIYTYKTVVIYFTQRRELQDTFEEDQLETLIQGDG